MLPTTTAIETTTDEVLRPKDFIDSIHEPRVEKNFIEIFESPVQAKSFIQSVVLLYRADEKLHVCTQNSIISAALRSASCKLQVDPTYRQAYIIPRNRKIKTYKDPRTELVVPEHYIVEANFQPHYHGLEVLAHRTNLYRVINVSPIYKGQRVLEDIHTGLHYFTIADIEGVEIMAGNTGEPILAMPSRVSQLRDATKGRQPIEDVIGYLAYFETFRGQKKTEWMAIAEIEDHARKYSDAYTSKYSLWANGNPHRAVMQMKTCFIRLTKSMDLSSREHEVLARASKYGDEAQQDFEDEINSDDPNLDTVELHYQTDEFSQDAPSPIILNTPPVTTGGQARAVVAETQNDTRKVAPPLPTVKPIGVPPLSYARAKAYFLGSMPLEKVETTELEAALDRPTLAKEVKSAIQVVLDWRILEKAKDVLIGEKPLRAIETNELETALENPETPQETQKAIVIVLHSRKANRPQ